MPILKEKCLQLHGVVLSFTIIYMTGSLCVKLITGLWRTFIWSTWVMHLPWLQRLLLKLQPYDITIKYVPGQKVPVADALSRVSPSGKTEIKGLDVTIHDLTTTLNHVQVEAIQQAIREDQVLQMLMQQMMQGWPDHIKLLPVALKPLLAVKRGPVHWALMCYLSG